MVGQEVTALLALQEARAAPQVVRRKPGQAGRAVVVVAKLQLAIKMAPRVLATARSRQVQEGAVVEVAGVTARIPALVVLEVEVAPTEAAVVEAAKATLLPLRQVQGVRVLSWSPICRRLLLRHLQNSRYLGAVFAFLEAVLLSASFCVVGYEHEKY